MKTSLYIQNIQHIIIRLRIYIYIYVVILTFHIVIRINNWCEYLQGLCTVVAFSFAVQTDTQAERK